MLQRTLCGISILCAGLVSLPALGADTHEELAVEPQAEKILQQMTKYLNTLEQFTFHVENTDDWLLSSGQKLQYAGAVDVSVRRPNRFRANVQGDIDNQHLFYDGHTITLWNADLNYYGTLEAPSTIEAALDHALEAFALRAPLSDLIRQDAFAILTEHVESGVYVGLHDVHGVACHHLAFRQEDIDWQVWIEASDTPLLRKLIITQKYVAGAPQFTAWLSDWNPSAKLPDSLFIFMAPDKAKRVEFLPVERQGLPPNSQ